MMPWLDDGDVRLYQGDALEVLRSLPDGCVHMCATSPPFYGLRSYIADGHEDKPLEIGLEETPDQWVDRLVAVFREVRRVLRDDGTLWVEIGDSYASTQATGGGYSDKSTLAGFTNPNTKGRQMASATPSARLIPNAKPKDLLGQPWLLAFALRADGWYLRSEIIWARPNPMPESVTDRPTKSHSTIFLLSKRTRYYFDSDAIREPYAQKTLTHRGGGGAAGKAGNQDPNGKVASGNWGDWGAARTAHPAPVPQSETLDGSDGEAPRGPDGRRVTTVKGTDASEQHRDGERWPNPSGANARSVWLIPTEPTPFAHFATFPQALVRRMILAGTSERGACPECGAPWGRDVERTFIGRQLKPITDDAHVQGRNGLTGDLRSTRGATLGWSPSCTHDASPIPCTVLDVFAGSGTTSLVARNHGRHSIGIELNEQYLEIAAKRLQQLSLLTEGATP